LRSRERGPKLIPLADNLLPGGNPRSGPYHPCKRPPMTFLQQLRLQLQRVQLYFGFHSTVMRAQGSRCDSISERATVDLDCSRAEIAWAIRSFLRLRARATRRSTRCVDPAIQRSSDLAIRHCVGGVTGCDESEQMFDWETSLTLAFSPLPAGEWPLPPLMTICLTSAYVLSRSLTCSYESHQR
jgi:hypothetical protein